MLPLYPYTLILSGPAALPMALSWLLLLLHGTCRKQAPLCPVFVVKEWMEGYYLAQGDIMQQSTLQ